MRALLFYMTAGVALSGSVTAQTVSGTDYLRLAEDKEIALARSAAPDVVSADATIWVLRNGEYAIAVRGSNANHCFVSRSMPQSLEPVCYDEEGAATVLPWEFKYFELRTSGKSEEEREAALAKAIGSGELRAPGRPSMSYMLSSAQRLFDPESGRSAGNWKPHLMLYIPYLTDESIGLSAGLETLQVSRPGTPMAYLIIVVPEFVDPKAP
ncbi:MAG: hypothetical protein O7E49_03540 [Gemmatimonadetes bacterium]|jgi:hypothetical protein|nr:hypothetical protein [Gemmatimonadota bacterium]